MTKLREARFDDMNGAKQMHNSDAKGKPLLYDGGKFGGDIIEFPPDGRVEMHTHPGAHMLFAIRGNGQVVRGDETTDLEYGCCYLVESMEPHAVYAGKLGLTLLVVGDDVRHVWSADRLDMCEATQ